MLERALTTQCCREMIALLRKRGWTAGRISRTIGATSDYVKRIEAGKQSFQLAEVEALAKALRQPAHILIFESMDRDSLAPELRGLHDLAAQEVERHKDLGRALSRKRTKKRGTRTRVA